jgi:hypothetical protein
MTFFSHDENHCEYQRASNKKSRKGASDGRAGVALPLTVTPAGESLGPYGATTSSVKKLTSTYRISLKKLQMSFDDLYLILPLFFIDNVSIAVGLTSSIINKRRRRRDHITR